MKVLDVGTMFPPHYLGGYELIWRSAVRRARAAGHDVRVLTTDYRSPDAPEAPANRQSMTTSSAAQAPVSRRLGSRRVVGRA